MSKLRIPVFVVCVIACTLLIYLWKSAENGSPSSDTTSTPGSAEPSPEITRLFGTTQAYLSSYFPAPLSHGAWSSWGPPPLQESKGQPELPHKTTGETHLFQIESNLFLLTGSQTHDIGAPTPWATVVGVETQSQQGHQLSRIVVHFARVGNKTKGRIPPSCNHLKLTSYSIN